MKNLSHYFGIFEGMLINIMKLKFLVLKLVNQLNQIKCLINLKEFNTKRKTSIYHTRSLKSKICFCICQKDANKNTYFH